MRFSLQSEDLNQQGRNIINTWYQYHLQYTGIQQLRHKDGDKKFLNVFIEQLRDDYKSWYYECYALINSISPETRDVFSTYYEYVLDCVDKPFETGHLDLFVDYLNKQINILRTSTTASFSNPVGLFRTAIRQKEIIMKLSRWQLVIAILVALTGLATLVVAILQTI